MEVVDDGRGNREDGLGFVLEGVVEKLKRSSEDAEEVELLAVVIEEAKEVLERGKGDVGVLEEVV